MNKKTDDLINKISKGEKYENIKEEIDKLVDEIDNKILELEKEEALDNVKECVGEILKIDDLKAYREKNYETHSDRILTIVAWFNYLKRKHRDTKEYEEAKELVLSIGKKHPKLANWCEELVNKPLVEPPVLLLEAEINLEKTNELIVKDGVKITVNAKQAKKLVDSKAPFGSEEYKKLKVEYKVIVNKKQYDCIYHIVDLIRKCDRPKDCPYMVTLSAWEKNSKGERIVKFNVLEIDPNIENKN